MLNDQSDRESGIFMSTPKDTQKNKLVMLGDSGVGKTSIVGQWNKATFKEDQNPTIGAAYSQTVFTYQGEEKKIQVWDTAGEEKYRSMAPIYSQNAFAAMLVFDLTNYESLNNILEWMNIVEPLGDIALVLVGNKEDLAEERQVSREDAIEFADRLGIPYFETSASTGYGIENAFVELLEHAFQIRDSQNSLKADTIVNVADETPAQQSSSCC